MAHFAKLDENNEVVQVITVHNNVLLDDDGQEQESLGVAFCVSLFGEGTWKQTSYNLNMRGKFAALGDTYHSDIDAFMIPKPYDSWVKDTETKTWEAPVSCPVTPVLDEEGNPVLDEAGNQVLVKYAWDEDTTSWVEHEGTMP